MKRILAALLLVVFAWLPAEAEVKESEYSASPTDSARTAPVAVDNKKPIRPTLNITQPELQVDQPTYLLAPTVTRPKKATVPRKKKRIVTRKKKPAVKKRRRYTRRKAASSRKARLRKARAARREEKRIAAEKWWQDTGNPAVFIFRDCLSHHAVRYRDLAGPAPAEVQIAKAMDLSCRSEFDHMARTIAGQFGEDGFRKLAHELIETTFVPAAAEAQ